ncbi:MAG: lysophospholipid acyltransferase family protein [Bacteroidaceae bacterium]|nr:lysophospholipid acyltransferase family protein [Bacteroidaceae bacterium]
MSALIFYVVRALWYLMSLLPMKILYFFSDLLFYLIYYIVGYRRKVVRRNLTNSFPEKSPKEIERLEKRFYHSLCDYFMETMKLYGMTEEQARKRIQFTGLEEVEKAIARGQSVVAYMAHTINWEYATLIPLWIKDKNAQVGHIYHPLENKHFDDFFKKVRGQYNSENISMAATLRRIVELSKQGRQFIIGFIADQVPTWEAINHWLTFFNQETAVFTGTEKIARRTHSAVFFLKFTREKRGRYTAHFVPMCDDAAQLPELELTNMYYRLLEESIKETPHLWLWTHNRWKRTRQGQIEREKRREEGRRLLEQRERERQQKEKSNV